MRSSLIVALVVCWAGSACQRAPSVDKSASGARPAEPVTCVDGWCRFPAFLPAFLIRALEPDGTQVWIADAHGVARWDGGPEDLPERWAAWTFAEPIYDIWVDDGVVLAVGDHGFVTKFESGAWTTIASNVVDPLHNVDGAPGGPAWIMSERSLLRLDGTTFTSVELPPSVVEPKSIEVVSADEVWVAANSAWQLARGEWREHSFDGKAVEQLDSSGPNDVWARVDGHALRWNGSSWLKTNPPGHIQAIHVRSPNDVVAADDIAGYSRWDGQAWTKLGVRAHGSQLS